MLEPERRVSAAGEALSGAIAGGALTRAHDPHAPAQRITKPDVGWASQQRAPAKPLPQASRASSSRRWMCSRSGAQRVCAPRASAAGPCRVPAARRRRHSCRRLYPTQRPHCARRFQLQRSSPFGHAARYTSLRQATALLLKEEGLRTLWRGNASAMALWVGYSAIQFPAYRLACNALDALWASRGNSSPPPAQLSALLAGGCAGLLATTCTYPLDWVRTRMASQGVPKASGQRALAPRACVGGEPTATGFATRTLRFLILWLTRSRLNGRGSNSRGRSVARADAPCSGASNMPSPACYYQLPSLPGPAADLRVALAPVDQRVADTRTARLLPGPPAYTRAGGAERRSHSES